MADSTQIQLTVDYVKSIVAEFIETGCSTTHQIDALMKAVLAHKYNDAVEYFWNTSLTQILIAMLHFQKTDKNKKLQTDVFNLIYEIIRQLKNGYKQGLTIDNLITCFGYLLFSGNSLYLVDYGKPDKMALMPLISTGCHIKYSTKNYEVYRVEADNIYVLSPSDANTKYKIPKNDKGISLNISDDSLNPGYEAWLKSLTANSPVDIFYNEKWISATVIGLSTDEFGTLSVVVRYAPLQMDHEEVGIAYIPAEKEYLLPYTSMSRGSTLDNNTPTFNNILYPSYNMASEAKDANTTASTPNYTCVPKALLIILNFVIRNKLWHEIFDLVEKNIRYMTTQSFVLFMSTIANVMNLLNQFNAKQYIESASKIFKAYIETFKNDEFVIPSVDTMLHLYTMYNTLLNRFNIKSKVTQEIDYIVLHTISVLFHSNTVVKHQLSLSLISVLTNWVDDTKIQPPSDVLFDPSVYTDDFTDVIYKHTTKLTEESIATFFKENNLFDLFIISEYHVDLIMDATRFVQLCLKFNIITEDLYKIVVDEISYGVEKWLNLFSMSLTQFAPESFATFIHCLYSKYIYEYQALCLNQASPTSTPISNEKNSIHSTFKRSITSTYLSSKSIDIFKRPLLSSLLIQTLSAFIPYINSDNKVLLLKFILSLTQGPSALNTTILNDYTHIIQTLYTEIHFGKLRIDLLYNAVELLNELDSNNAIYMLLLINSLLKTYCITDDELEKQNAAKTIPVSFSFRDIFTLDNTVTNTQLKMLKEAPYILSKDMILSKLIGQLWSDSITNIYVFIKNLFDYLSTLKPKITSKFKSTRTTMKQEVSENQYYLNSLFTLNSVIEIYFETLTLFLNNSSEEYRLTEEQMGLLMVIPQSEITSSHLELTLTFVQNIKKFTTEDYKYMLNKIPADLLDTLSTTGWTSFSSLFNSLNKIISTEDSVSFKYVYPPVCEDVLFNVIKLCQNDIVLRNALALLEQYFEYMDGGYENRYDFLTKNAIYDTIYQGLSNEVPIKLLKKYVDILKSTFKAIYNLEEMPLTSDVIRYGQPINITVTSSSSFNMSIPYNYKVYLLKSDIAKRINKSVSQFSLQYTNIELEDTYSLDFYDIQNKATIYIIENTNDEMPPIQQLPVSAPLVSISFVSHSNLYSNLINMLNKKKKDKTITTSLWQLLCMLPLWNQQITLLEQLNEHTFTDDLGQLWAEIFPDDVFICNYNLILLEWKINRTYSLFFNRDVVYEGRQKESQNKDIQLFITMMKSGFVNRALYLLDTGVDTINGNGPSTGAPAIKSRLDVNNFTIFYKSLFVGILRILFSSMSLYYLNKDRETYEEFLLYMTFSERDYNIAVNSGAKTSLTLAQVKNKDYTILHTATYVYFNEEDTGMIMDSVEDFDGLLDILKESNDLLYTWKERYYIIQLIHKLLSLCLSKIVNIFEPLLFFLYKLYALLMIANDDKDNKDLVKDNIESMVKFYLDGSISPFLSECSCYDVYYVVFTYNDKTINEVIFTSVINLFFNTQMKNLFTDAASRLLVECLRYIEDTLPSKLVLDCIHKISDYIKSLSEENKTSILLKIITLFSSLLQNYKEQSQEMKGIVTQLLTLVLIPSTPLAEDMIDSIFSFIQKYTTQNTNWDVLKEILKPLDYQKPFMSTLLEISLPAKPYFLTHTTMGIEKDLNSFVGLTCSDEDIETQSVPISTMALTPLATPIAGPTGTTHGRLDYIYCVLQLLYLNPKFRDHVSRTAFISAHANIGHLIQILFLSLYCSRYATVDISPLYKFLLSLKNTDIDMSCQQSPMVFFKWLISYLERSAVSYNTASLLQSIFQGDLSETHQCSSCGERATTALPYGSLSIDIKDMKTLKDAIDTYFTNELNPVYSCSKCNNANTSSHVSRLLQTLPDSLVIELKRFNKDPKTGITTKINTLCDIPTDINLFKYTQEGVESQGQIRDEKKNPLSNYQYEIRCIVIHDGLNPDNGHYYLLYKDRNNKDRWYKIDDDRVVIIDESAVKALASGGEEASSRTGNRMIGRRRGLTSASNNTPKFKSYCAYMCIYEKESIINNYIAYNNKDMSLDFMSQQQSLYNAVAKKNMQLVTFKTSTELPFVKFIHTIAKLFGSVLSENYKTRDYQDLSQFIYQTLYLYSVKILSRVDQDIVTDENTNYPSTIFTYLFQQLKFTSNTVASMTVLLSTNSDYLLNGFVINPVNDLRQAFFRILRYAINVIAHTDQGSSKSILCSLCNVLVSKEMFTYSLHHWYVSQGFYRFLYQYITAKDNKQLLLYFHYNNIIANMINAYIECYEDYIKNSQVSQDEEETEESQVNFFNLSKKDQAIPHGKQGFFEVLYALIQSLPSLSPGDSLHSPLYKYNPLANTVSRPKYNIKQDQEVRIYAVSLSSDSFSSLSNMKFYIYALNSGAYDVVLNIIKYICQRNLAFYEFFIQAILDFVLTTNSNNSNYSIYFNSVLYCRKDNNKFGYKKRLYDIFLKEDGLLNQLEYLSSIQALHVTSFILSLLRDPINTSKIYEYYSFSNPKWQIMEGILLNEESCFLTNKDLQKELEFDKQIYSKYIHKLNLGDDMLMLDDDLMVIDDSTLTPNSLPSSSLPSVPAVANDDDMMMMDDDILIMDDLPDTPPAAATTTAPAASTTTTVDANDDDLMMMDDDDMLMV